MPKQDSYPIPRMDECMNLLGKPAFSTLNANSSYLQIESRNADNDKPPSNYTMDFIVLFACPLVYAMHLTHFTVLRT